MSYFFVIVTALHKFLSLASRSINKMESSRWAILVMTLSTIAISENSPISSLVSSIYTSYLTVKTSSTWVLTFKSSIIILFITQHCIISSNIRSQKTGPIKNDKKNLKSRHTWMWYIIHKSNSNILVKWLVKIV